MLHDNARPHIIRQTVVKITKLNMEVLPLPSYSPDLTPTNYHVFMHLHMSLLKKISIKNRIFIDSHPPDVFNKGH